MARIAGVTTIMMMTVVVVMAIMAAVEAAQPPTVRQVAMFCGKLNMHVSLTSGSWEPDPAGSTSCLSSSRDILKYCQQVYPEVRVTGVEASTEPVSVSNWCRKGRTHCGGHTHIVIPYNCLVEQPEEVDQEVEEPEVEEEEEEVEEVGAGVGDRAGRRHGDAQADGCVDMGQMKLDECHPARFWKRLARTMCVDGHLREHTPKRRCGTGGFRGVEYTCCHRPAPPTPRRHEPEERNGERYRADDYDNEETEEEEEVEVPGKEVSKEADEEESDRPQVDFSQDEEEDEQEVDEQEEEEVEGEEVEEEEEEGEVIDLSDDQYEEEEEEQDGDKPHSSPYEDDLALWFDIEERSSEEAPVEIATEEEEEEEDYIPRDDEEEEEVEEEVDYETAENSDAADGFYNVEYEWPGEDSDERRQPASSEEVDEAEEEAAEENGETRTQTGENSADENAGEIEAGEREGEWEGESEGEREQDVVRQYLDAPPDDELEHERFLKAKEQLEVQHHLRLIQIMKSWEEAKISAENRPNSERQLATLIKRFQRLVHHLDAALASARQRLGSAHQQRVEEALAMERRHALEAYLGELQAETPRREHLLRSVRRYLWAEQRAQIHCVRRFQHLQRGAAGRPPTPPGLLMVQAHLTVIKKRLNESLSLLNQVPRLAPGIETQIGGLAAYVQSYGQGLLSVGHSYGSDGLLPPSAPPPPPAVWFDGARSGPATGGDDDTGKNMDEDLSSGLFQMEGARRAERFDTWAVVALLVGIIIVVTVVITVSLLLLRRKVYRPVSTAEVEEELSHEERHLSKMQQNGYENPTYKLYEALQH